MKIALEGLQNPYVQCHDKLQEVEPRESGVSEKHYVTVLIHNQTLNSRRTERKAYTVVTAEAGGGRAD